MLIPFQRLLHCSSYGRGIVLAAAGHSIYAFQASDGSLLHKWSSSKLRDPSTKSPRDGESSVQDGASQEPLEKRRKTSHDVDASEASSAEIVTENGKKRKRKLKPKLPSFPSISNLCGTKDGRHIVAVTGEDKCLHVLELLKSGELQQRSERIMPKRPSAVTLTPDQQTILCADKFGDVYCLPLIPTVKQNSDAPFQADNIAKDVNDGGAQMRTPAATNLTVWTKKNREALANQQKLAHQRPSEKREAEFEHDLLLGHVSLLTEIICTTLEISDKSRVFIITADRDEHIRVSRGAPQAHIIERYCHGHEQFVSKMCCPPWQPELIVSGGGDDYILCFDWTSGLVKGSADIRAACDKLLQATSEDAIGANDRTAGNVAVSGIWAVMTTSGVGLVVVACEAVPGLLCFKLGQEGSLTSMGSVKLPHNVLDVSVDPDSRSILCSMDIVHVAGSRSVTENNEGTEGAPLSVWKFVDDSQSWQPLHSSAVEAMNKEAAKEKTGERPDWLGEMYYGIEHLRKQNVAESEHH